MAQFSVKIISLTGSVLGETQHASVADLCRSVEGRIRDGHLAADCASDLQRIAEEWSLIEPVLQRLADGGAG